MHMADIENKAAAVSLHSETEGMDTTNLDDDFPGILRSSTKQGEGKINSDPDNTSDLSCSC